MTWIDEFAAALTPQWVAELFQTVLGAAIAFLGAFYLVRLQLKHDRQRVVEAENRIRKSEAQEVERRAVFGRKAAAEILAQKLVMVQRDYADNSDSYLEFRSSEPPHLHDIAEAFAEAEKALGTLSEGPEILDEWSAVWAYCRERSRSAAGTAAEKNVREAADATISLVLSDIGSAATLLKSWSGREEIPTRASIPETRRVISAGARRGEGTIDHRFTRYLELATERNRAKPTWDDILAPHSNE